MLTWQRHPLWVQAQPCRRQKVRKRKNVFFLWSTLIKGITNRQCKSCVEEQHCPSGWQRLSQGKHCYRLFQVKKTWSEAEKFCNGQGGHLAAVTNQEIHNYINGKSAQVWVGGTDQGSEGHWRWSDCSAWSFTMWITGQPNNGNAAADFLQFDSENCLQLRYRGTDKWGDAKCSYKEWFVCSKKLCPPITVSNIQNLQFDDGYVPLLWLNNNLKKIPVMIRYLDIERKLFFVLISIQTQ